MPDLYIANKSYSSWSLRPWVLMKQLGIVFQEHVVPFEDPHAWQVYRQQVSPSGKVPVLISDQGTVWDSLAIAEHLAEQHAGVWPADGAARTWARCAAAEMHSGFGALRSQCSMTCVMRIELNEVNAALQADLDRLQALWREGLARFGGPFLAGPTFTAVDAFFCPVAWRIWAYGLKVDAPSQAYVQHLLALPAMQQWQQQALLEAPDPAHEVDCLKGGRCLQDLRLNP